MSWFGGKSDAEKLVDELSAHVNKLRDKAHELEAKIDQRRRSGLDTTELQNLHTATKKMYQEALAQYRVAIARWGAEK